MSWPLFTPEERLQYPSIIWLIKRKEKRDLIIDAKNVQTLIDSLNTWNIIFLKDHNTTIHKFDIEDISIVNTSEEHMVMINKMCRSNLKDYTLSLNSTIEWLKRNENPWMTLKN